MVIQRRDLRLEQLEQWLAGLFGARDFTVAPASADASFRRYFRVSRQGHSWIAMDAPPGKEDMGPYIRVSAMLVDVGVNAPKVLHRDEVLGFLLNTDLGSRTYLADLDAGADAERLYRRRHRIIGRYSSARRPARQRVASLTTTRCCVVKWGCSLNGSATSTWACS